MFVVNFFRGNPIPKFFTSTSIALIPKSNAINFWNNYRPISLCTFFNKLIAKIIMGRLTLILFTIILLEQISFVKGRSKFDNVLLAQELVHDLHAKVAGGNIIFKADITKACDNLN